MLLTKPGRKSRPMQKATKTRSGFKTFKQVSGQGGTDGPTAGIFGIFGGLDHRLQPRPRGSFPGSRSNNCGFFSIPSFLSRTDFARWWIGGCFERLMVHMKFKATPVDLRYLHHDPAENEAVLLRELLHCFQRDMTHDDRQTLRAYIVLFLTPHRHCLHKIMLP